MTMKLMTTYQATNFTNRAWGKLILLSVTLAILVMANVQISLRQSRIQYQETAFDTPDDNHLQMLGH